MARAVQVAEEQAARRRQELSTPEGRERRSRSRSAFRGLGRSEAADAARDHFRGFYAEPLWSGPKPKDGERFGRFLSDYARVLERPDGRDFVVRSTAPLRTEDELGTKREVDAGLVERRGALEPRNIPNRLRIGKDTRDGVAIGDEIIMRMAGTDSPSDALVRDDKAFFANVGPGPDTDLTVAAVPGGAELAFQLRSPASPEDPAIEFNLPPGARLRATGAGGAAPDGGAEVVRGDQVIATVHPPIAYDADAQAVEAAYEVRGHRLIVRVDHRDEDLRYPILVDPYVKNDFYSAGFVNHINPAYRWQDHNQRPDKPFGYNASVYGLNVKMFALDYPQWNWGEWYFKAPNAVQIVRTNFKLMSHFSYWSCAEVAIARDREQTPDPQTGKPTQGLPYQACFGNNGQYTNASGDWVNVNYPPYGLGFNGREICTAHPDCSS